MAKDPGSERRDERGRPPGRREAEHQFEIQLGHVCNNRCVFCSSGQLTSKGLARPVPLTSITSAMDDARRSGARRVTFLGGEPTLHKDFLPAVRHAARVGFEELVVFTNGTRLAGTGLIDEVSSLGRVEWRVSLQGGGEAAHEAVTRSPGSFGRLMEGLRMLRERGQRITTNLCACEVNYRSLPELPGLVAEHGVSQVHVDIIRPSSMGERTREEARRLMARYSDMAPYMAHMLACFEREASEIDVGIGNLPFCILTEWSHKIRHGGEATVTRASDSSGLEDEVDKYAWHASMRRHLPRCEGCVMRERCTGIFEAYLELFGDEEIRPMSFPPKGG